MPQALLYLRSLKIIQEYHRAKPRNRWGTSTLFFFSSKIHHIGCKFQLVSKCYFLACNKKVSLPFRFCLTKYIKIASMYCVEVETKNMPSDYVFLYFLLSILQMNLHDVRNAPSRPKLVVIEEK